MRYARPHAVALILACGWLGAGCVDDSNSLAIIHFVHLDPMANQCVANPTSTLLESSGDLDAAIAKLTGVGYILSPVVVNNLQVSTTSASPVNTIFVTGFDVELRPDPADGALAAALPSSQRSFHIPAAGGAIDPGGANGAMSQLALAIEVVNGQVAQLLLPAIPAGTRDPLPLTVHVRPVGTHSGLNINGGYQDFPIYVCNGCLNSTAPCPAAGIMSSLVVNGCNPAQDVETCCTNAAGTLLCGSQVPMHP
jgi:hypothetical protein